MYTYLCIHIYIYIYIERERDRERERESQRKRGTPTEHTALRLYHVMLTRGGTLKMKGDLQSDFASKVLSTQNLKMM